MNRWRKIGDRCLKVVPVGTLMQFALTWGLLLLAASAFTYLNVEKRFFLKCLGDDCEAGAKTNWISLGVGGALLSLLVTLTWRTFNTVSQPVRMAVELVSVTGGLTLLQEFLRWNWWL